MGRALIVMVFLLTLGGPAPCVAASAEETAGVVRIAAGQATVTRAGRVFPAAAGTKLRVGDVLATGPDGSVGVILRDNSTLSLGPESNLVIRKFLFAPAEGKLGLLVRLSKGTMACISGLIGKLAPESVRFETPTATIGIRGTRFAVKSKRSGPGAGSGPRAIPRRLAACLSVVLLAAACATTPHRATSGRDVVVLLPDEEGKAGGIVVSAGGGERLLTEPRQAVTVAPGAVPGEPFVMTDEEVRAVVGPALDALPKPPVQFLLYFKRNSPQLAGESPARIRDVVRTIKERASTDVSVVGHTDTMGDKSYNYKLSRERAQAVAALLVANGVDPSILEIASHGKDNPLVSTGDQVPEPRNRRVEVTVR